MEESVAPIGAALVELSGIGSSLFKQKQAAVSAGSRDQKGTG